MPLYFPEGDLQISKMILKLALISPRRRFVELRGVQTAWKRGFVGSHEWSVLSQSDIMSARRVCDGSLPTIIFSGRRMPVVGKLGW